jgi:hypothetical protein
LSLPQRNLIEPISKGGDIIVLSRSTSPAAVVAAVDDMLGPLPTGPFVLAAWAKAPVGLDMHRGWKDVVSRRVHH